MNTFLNAEDAEVFAQNAKDCLSRRPLRKPLVPCRKIDPLAIKIVQGFTVSAARSTDIIVALQS